MSSDDSTASLSSPTDPPASDSAAEGATPQPDGHQGLTSVSFVSLLIVQFLTVLNDHTFRWLVVPIAKPLMGQDNDAAALSLGLAFFILPALLLATPAGYLADRFCKSRVITACKFGEVFIMALGLATLSLQNVACLFAVVALTGALAALFAPSKLGCIPELVRDSQLANANGWMGLMNVVPCALGFLLGNFLAVLVRPKPNAPLSATGLTIAATIILLTALVGWAASLLIRRVPAADPQRPFDPNLLQETIRGLGHLSADVPLLRTAVGIAFFWMLASLAQLNVDQFGIRDLGLDQQDIGILGALLVVGVGVGSLLAGKLSAGHIELGLVPLGALGMAGCSMALFLPGNLIRYRLGWHLPGPVWRWCCWASRRGCSTSRWKRICSSAAKPNRWGPRWPP